MSSKILCKEYLLLYCVSLTRFFRRRPPVLHVNLFCANFTHRLVIGQSLDPTFGYLCNANYERYIVWFLSFVDCTNFTKICSSKYYIVIYAENSGSNTRGLLYTLNFGTETYGKHRTEKRTDIKHRDTLKRGRYRNKQHRHVEGRCTDAQRNCGFPEVNEPVT